MQETLRTTKDQAFNLQINQHFLFNTLNTIAGLAVREEAISTYEAVGDLAQLLRYTLRTDSYFVTLGEELEYLKNYTYLQKLRFRKRLEVEYTVPVSLLEEKVPFNFLQPIVENCFTHGFRNKTEIMGVSVQAEQMEETIRFRIADNGEGMDIFSLEKLREKMRKGDGSHGMGMVVQKLKSLYGDSAFWAVESSEKGTVVSVCIPMERRGQDEESFTGR